MRMSRDKINVLARRITDAMIEFQDQNRLEFIEDPNSTRLEVRRILEELRRRFADPQRPQIELDYIERLLKDF